VSLLTRRDFVLTAAAGTLLSARCPAQPSATSTEPPMNAAAFELQYSPKPLPFDPRKLTGLSERLVQSHWENNYSGAVRALNAVRGRLREQLEAKVPPYIYNGLKREQLLRTGSVVMHELYFANLGGSDSAGAELRTRIAADFGSYDAWEREFRTIGEGLGGGSGWVVLGFNEHLGMLENCWMADHSTSSARTRPVLVMDMYEHAYHLDFGAGAARYIDAFFANINWEVVSARLDTRAGTAVRSS
jgi:Fe-Mn family superoxide dismutase